MKTLASLTVKFRFLFLTVFILAAAAGVRMAVYTNVNYDMTKYLPDNSPQKRLWA